MFSRFLVSLLLFAATASPARAVIVFGSYPPPSEDPHADRPVVTDGAGWDYEGDFGGFLGTPIGPRHFLTAAHIGGGPGQSFTYAGQTYLTVRSYDDPDGSDLHLWEVDRDFERFAPIFDRPGDEVGRGLYVFGRGAQRGVEIHVPAGDPDPETLAGWMWGVDNYFRRWGRNVVTGIDEGYLLANFDAAGTADSVGDDEAQLSVGDSGGGVFIQDNGVWKLAGINYGVTGPYNYTATGVDAFSAAIFKGPGLFENGGSAGYVAATGPGLFAATAVSLRLGFLRVATGQAPLARIGNDMMLFGFRSESGKSYRVEFSDDLATGVWEPVANAGNVAGNGGVKLVTDPGAAGQSRRFYRVVTLP